jgi:hypothetical protein
MNAETLTNLPSDETALQENLDEAYRELKDRAKELLEAEARLPAITDDETSGRVSDYVALIRAAIKAADGSREKEKGPYLLGGRRVDGYFNKGIIDPLDKLRTRVQAKQTTYLREVEAVKRRELDRLAEIARQEERKRQEEAERLAAAAKTAKGLDKAIVAEQAAAAATLVAHETQQAASVKPAELSRVRGEHSTSSLVTFMDFKNLDRDTIDLGVLRPYLSMDAIQVAVRLAIKAGVREISGVDIFENTRAR